MTRLQSFTRAFALGLIGIGVLVLVAEPPAGMPRVLLAVNPLILLLIFGFLGSWAAPKKGFKSALILADSFDATAALRAFGITIVLGALIGLGDFLTQPIWVPDGTDAVTSLSDSVSLSGLLFGITYGGITEEIMMRFGLMSGVMLGLSVFLPRSAAAWIAILFAALFFAAGHLPAVIAAGLELEPPLVARIILLNGCLGIWFGWLYYRHDLETAIAAHAGFHVGVFLLGSFWG